MKTIQVEGRSGLVKDPNSGAILSNDRSGLDTRLAERERVRRMNNDHELIQDLLARVRHLESIAVNGAKSRSLHSCGDGGSEI
jgi:hypothetical protein